MKIFFACHRLPYPPKRGGKIRPFNIIRHLTEAGHRVTVASIARSQEELAEGQPLRNYCEALHVGLVGRVGPMANMIGRLATPMPSSIGYFVSGSLHQELTREYANEAFDLTFVHCSSAAQYALPRNSRCSIIDFGDMDSRKWADYGTFKPFPLSMGYRLEAAKLQREERKLAGLFDLSTCTTRAELESLQELGAAPATDWFPNGVDSDFFAPTAEPYDADTLCFIGRMDYYPNQQAMLWFCDEVFERIRRLRSSAKLTIVGAEPSAEIRKLADRDGITVTGTVPDVRDYVRAAAVSVAPLIIARGTQNKILESMAMGVPVIASELAAKGVDAVPGEHLLTATAPDEYATAVVSLLNDPQRRRQYAEAGRDRVLRHHNWAASMRQLDSIIARAVGGASA